MTHGARGGLIQPYCLLSVGLHHAPAGLSVGLCDVDVREGKTFNINALLGCWKHQLSLQGLALGPRVLANGQKKMSVQVGCDLGLVFGLWGPGKQV